MDITGLGSVFDFADGVIKRILPEKASEEDRLKAKITLQQMLEKRENELISAKKDILIAEITGESWLQKNWRPVLMLVVVAIIANNYLLFPYLSLFTDNVVILELPDKLYNLMTIGVGGYVAGRSVEKGIAKWKEK